MVRIAIFARCPLTKVLSRSRLLWRLLEKAAKIKIGGTTNRITMDGGNLIKEPPKYFFKYKKISLISILKYLM